MKLCPRCNAEMTNITGGNYYCQKCGMAIDDLVLRDYKGTSNIAIEKITPNTPEVKPFGMTGWICPKCNRGISPFVNVCPCTNYTSNLATVNVNGSVLNNGNTNTIKVQGIYDGELKEYTKPEVDKRVQEVINTLNTLSPDTDKIKAHTTSVTSSEQINPLTSKL